MLATLEPKMSETPACVSWILDTPVGGLRIECSPRGITQITFLKEKVTPEQSALDAATRAFLKEHPWAGRLAEALRAYFAGEQVDFTVFPLDLAGQPDFWRQVLDECRKIPYGQTLSYAELAARAGRPSAVRAAGSAMSHNPIPILIPCHRVVRSDGGLGGYGAPEGIALKRRLLQMEGVEV